MDLVDGVQVGEEQQERLLRQRAQADPGLLLLLANLVAEPLEQIAKS